MAIFRSFCGVFRYALIAMMAVLSFPCDVFGENGTYLWAWDWEGWGGPSASICPKGCICPGETFVAKTRNLPDFCGRRANAPNDNRLTCSKVTNSADAYYSFDKCGPAAWIGAGDDGKRGRDPLYRCPEDYPNTDSEGSRSQTDCYVDLPTGYKVMTPGGAVTPCESSEKCPSGKVYFGETALPMSNNAGFINLVTEDSDFSVSPKRLCVKASEDDPSMFILYVDQACSEKMATNSNFLACSMKGSGAPVNGGSSMIENPSVIGNQAIDLVDHTRSASRRKAATKAKSLTKSRAGTTIGGVTLNCVEGSETHSITLEGGGENKQFVGFFDVNNKKRINEKGFLVNENLFTFYDLFPDNNTNATWYAKYSRAYTVTLDTSGGQYEDTDENIEGFVVFDGSIYSMPFVLGEKNVVFDGVLKVVPTKEDGFFAGFYYGSEQMIDERGVFTGIGYDAVDSIKRNQTWTAKWKKVYNVTLKDSKCAIEEGESINKECVYGVFDGKLYDKKGDATSPIGAESEINIKTFKIEQGQFPTKEGSIFGGYYYNGEEMINKEGEPGDGFVEAIETMTGNRTWSPKWLSVYNVMLNNGCSDKDEGCITELAIGKGKAYSSKEISETGAVIQSSSGGALDKINVLPTKSGYVFEGYRYAQTLMIDKDGNITKDAKGIMETMAANQIWTAQWTECSTGAVEKNICVMCEPGQYLLKRPTIPKPGENYVCENDENGENDKEYCCVSCPQAGNGYFGEDALYKFTLDKDYPLSLKSVDSCAIKLNTAKSACDANSNVILNYRASENAYVRKDVFEVYPSAKSMLKKEAEYPAAIQQVGNIDFNTDYCELCGDDRFAIQVVEDGIAKTVCSFCDDGNCVEKDTDGTQECVACPAGFYCPNEGRNLMCSDIKPAEINENLTYICKTGEYSGVGASNCSQCLDGYSTDGSGPAETGGNGLCIGTDSVGSGIGCTHVRACRQITPQLCTVEDCECTIEKIKQTYSNVNAEGKNNTRQLVKKCHGDNRLTDNLLLSFYAAGSGRIRENAITSAAEAAFKNKKLARCLCQSSFDLGNDVKISKTYRDFVKTIKRVSQSDENQSD